MSSTKISIDIETSICQCLNLALSELKWNPISSAALVDV